MVNRSVDNTHPVNLPGNIGIVLYASKYENSKVEILAHRFTGIKR